MIAIISVEPIPVMGKRVDREVWKGFLYLLAKQTLEMLPDR